MPHTYILLLLGTRRILGMHGEVRLLLLLYYQTDRRRCIFEIGEMFPGEKKEKEEEEGQRK